MFCLYSKNEREKLKQATKIGDLKETNSAVGNWHDQVK